MKIQFVFLALALLFVGACHGACQTNQACTAIFDPICGKRVINGRTEFRTFGNSCIFNNCPEGFKFFGKGECRRR